MTNAKNPSEKLNAASDPSEDAADILKRIQTYEIDARNAKDSAKAAQKAAEAGLWPKVATMASIVAAIAASAAAVISQNQLDSVRAERQMSFIRQTQADFYLAAQDFLGRKGAIETFSQPYSEANADWEAEAALIRVFNTYIAARELRDLSENPIPAENWEPLVEMMCLSISKYPFDDHAIDFLDNMIKDGTSNQIALDELRACRENEEDAS